MPITSPFLFWHRTCYHSSAGGVFFCTLDRLYAFSPGVRDGHQPVTTGPYAVVCHPACNGSYYSVYRHADLEWMPDVTASRLGVLTIPGLKMGVLGWLVGRVITVIILVRT